MSDLSSGAGLCPATSQLSLRASKPAIELGAVVDVIHIALNTIHHANRHGRIDDRIAVALPGFHLQRGAACPGHEVVAFGSEEALLRLCALEGVQKLLRRGMIAEPDLAEVFRVSQLPGTAWLRDRREERRSPGAVRRALARAARRGKPMFQDVETRETDAGLLSLRYGDAKVNVRVVEGDVTDAPLMVGTYGFSSGLTPAVLPIRLDRAPVRLGDAA